MDLTGHTLLGKYQIEGLLGQGGMGAVWRARHALTGRKLAIKTLDEGYLDNPAVVQRFGREARAASACQHPGIVEVLDLDQTEEGIPFLVMEFLEGETLASRIERRGRLAQDEIVQIGTHLLEALDAAHGHGIIHRDLKPENIYVVPAGRRGEIVKILDFGISHKRDEAGEKLTMTGSVLGTPHYMSPEQAMGETELDHRADVYAAGVVLYECAVGDVPFDAPNYNKLLRTILDQPPAPPRRRGAQISVEMEKLILWAMEKEREKRVPSARDMLRWLERVHAGEAVPYTPPTSQPVRAATPSQPMPVQRPAGSLPFTPAGSLPPARSGLLATLGDGELAASDSWRPAALPTPPPSVELEIGPSSQELDLDFPLSKELDRSFADPKPARAASALDIDEAAIRSRSTPSSTSSSGTIAAVGSATQTGRHSIPPRVAELSGRFAPVEAPLPEPKSWSRYAVYGLVAIAIFVALVFAVRFIVNPGASDVPVEPAADAPVARPEAPVRGPSWVSVRIEGLPPGARVLLDGLPASTPVRMPTGGRHALEISAPGYQDRRIELTADRNRTIDADLRPAEGTVAPSP